MGNQCQGCLDNSISIQSEIDSTYLQIMSGTEIPADEQLPLDKIPQTVKQKIQLLKINIDRSKSKVRKYFTPQAKPDHIVYIIVKSSGKGKQQTQQLLVINKLKNQQQMQNSQFLKLTKFNPATILVFRMQNAQQINQSVDDRYEPNLQVPVQSSLVFQELFFGMINEKMKAQNAIKIFKNGQYYVGNIEKRILTGKGKIKNALGNHSYEGNWENNAPHDENGIQILEKVYQYQGKFEKGKWYGHGKLTLFSFPNSLFIQGNFAAGNLEGPGKIYDKMDNLIFQGSFKKGKEHGHGKWISSDGSIYQGEFVEGKKEGQGKYTFPTGTIYEGQFINGKPSGEGFIIKKGIKTRGYWYNGQNVLSYQN